jgi:menaquinol-cytochrome c reductase iron-sulfur subunit
MERENRVAEPVLDISRRKFLTSITMFLGGAISIVLGWNIVRYFVSPIWEKREDDFIPLCSLESLPKGMPLNVEYVQREKDGWEIHEGRNSLWLVREDNDEVVAFNKSCTHLGCPYRWDENEEVFKCPCHTAVFSKNGDVISGPPPRPLDRFPVKIENGMVLVKPESSQKEKV